MIVLDGQHLVAALLDNRSGDVCLAAGRVDSHNLVLQVEQLQQMWDSGDLMGLGIHGDLPQGQAGLTGSGTDDLQSAEVL